MFFNLSPLIYIIIFVSTDIIKHQFAYEMTKMLQECYRCNIDNFLVWTIGKCELVARIADYHYFVTMIPFLYQTTDWNEFPVRLRRIVQINRIQILKYML